MLFHFKIKSNKITIKITLKTQKTITKKNANSIHIQNREMGLERDPNWGLIFSKSYKKKLFSFYFFVCEKIYIYNLKELKGILWS